MQARFRIIPYRVCHFRKHFVGEIFAHDVRRILNPTRRVLCPVFVSEPKAALHRNSVVRILVGQSLTVNEVVHSRAERLIHDKRRAEKHFGGDLLFGSAVGELLLGKLAEPVNYVVLLQNNFRDFLLSELSFHELEDVRVVGVHDDHARRPACLAAGLNCACHFIPAAVERKRTGSGTLSRNRLAFASYRRNIYADARTAREYAALRILVAQNRVHRVLNAKNKACARLWICVPIDRFSGLYAVFSLQPVIGVVALVSEQIAEIRAPPSPLFPMPYVKPYGAVWRPHLVEEHVLHLLIVHERGLLVGEIPELVAPNSVRVCDAVENLLNGVFVFDSARIFAENIFAYRYF